MQQAASSFRGRSLTTLSTAIVGLLLAFPETVSPQSPWSGWNSFPPVSGGLASDVAVARNSDGRLSVFVVSRERVLWRASQSEPNGEWSAWEQATPPGMGVASATETERIAVGTNADGRLEVFVFAGGHLVHSWQTTPGGQWSEWAALSDLRPEGWSLADIAVGRNADGRLEVFAKSGYDGQLYQTWQSEPNGAWSGQWHRMGGPGGANAQLHGTFVTGLNRDGRQEVIAVDDDDRAWSVAQEARNVGWKDWVSLAGSLDGLSHSIALATNQDGRLELFAMAGTHLWHRWQDDSGAWTNGWSDLGSPPFPKPGFAVVRLADGRLAAFAWSAGGLYQATQSTVNGGWGGWVQTWNDPSVREGISLVAATNADGRQELFTRGKDDRVWHLWQTIAPSFIAPAPGTSAAPKHTLALATETGAIPFGNPAPPTGAPLDGATICGHATWLSGDNPPYEWMPVLTPGQELETTEVGVSGWAFNVHDSKEDVWFSHPFGNDHNMDVVPDAGYSGLIAKIVSGDQDREHALRLARDYYGLTATEALHTEIDGDFVPAGYGARDGDRVAIVGRWIVDCGHDNYNAEIHPPVVAVVARPENEDTTRVSVFSRPFLVGQEFDRGPLRAHLTHQLLRTYPLLLPFPVIATIEARPKILPKPIAARQQFGYILRPPGARRAAGDRLSVKYSLATRPGVTVSFKPAQDDGVLMVIAVDGDAYEPAPLPPKRNWVVSKSEINSVRPDVGNLITTLQSVGGTVAQPWGSVVLERGIDTDRYTLPVVVEAPPLVVTPSELFAATISSAATQPWPVRGTIELSWRRAPNLGPAITQVPDPSSVNPAATHYVPPPVVVPANQEWVPTHVRLTKGQHVSISAEGQWSNSGPPTLTADGFPNYVYPGTVLSTAALGSLIGRVGDVVFAVGKSFDGTSPADGQLFLQINDTPGTFGDNQGAVTVRVVPE